MSGPNVPQQRLYNRIAFHESDVSMSVRREERLNLSSDDARAEHLGQKLDELGQTIAAVGLSIVQAIQGGVR